MEKRSRAAIIGYGNIGKYAVDALNQAPDFELAGIIEKDSLIDSIKPKLPQIPVVSSVQELENIDVAILCIPTKLVPEYAKEILVMGINTVNSYDIHGELADLRNDLQPIAQGHNAVAIISAGWDPGTDSIIRCIFEFMAPKGITYTNFGPGMSMGHTVAVKAIHGVKNALAMTIPAGTGIHRRIVYVELAENIPFAQVENSIKNDPYFAKDETHVIRVNDVSKLIDVGHGVLIARKGVSGLTHNQLLNFEMKINNPALTAQIMVAAARASHRQKAGAYTMVEIPVIDFIYGERDEIIRKLV